MQKCKRLIRKPLSAFSASIAALCSLLIGCGDDGQSLSDSGALMATCLERAGLSRATEGMSMPTFDHDIERGNVDTPTLAGGEGFTVSVLQSAGSAPENGDRSYQLFVVRNQDGPPDEEVAPLDDLLRQGAVYYWRAPGSRAVRTAYRCLGVKR